MALSFYALLDQHSPEITLESLSDSLTEYFERTESGFAIDVEEDSFDPALKNILITWDGSWWMRFFLEEGAEVISDSSTISKLVHGGTRGAMPTYSRRIRALFADDAGRTYTNHIVYSLDFLEEIPGVAIFDPQNNRML